MDNKDYLEGVKAAQLYYNGQAYGSYTKHVRAEDAIKLFLPPIVEYLTQVSSPLPKARKDWIKGFSEEQINILREAEE